ncbi:hypothetical protein EDD22DRAFT_909591 [Suillus occidentalis]|nr:hypothetical protein EDD22DRAFT_909591 [Suillus occidentalis]
MLTENVSVKEVAEKLGATPAQVLVAWGVYRGYSVIPKSVQKNGLTDWLVLVGRIVSGFGRVVLSKEDYEKVAAIGVGNFERFNIPIRFKPKWDIALFGEELEKSATYQVKIDS